MALSESSKSEKIEAFSCGFLILRSKKKRVQFLLMKHKDRWDLPKGHVDKGESKQECALRELWEETGITEDQISIDPKFEFINRYHVTTKSGKKKLKELTIYLARLQPEHFDTKIKPTEHIGSQWFDWEPPHEIETRTIDGLLTAVAEYL